MSAQVGLPVAWSIANTTLTGVGLTAPIVQSYSYKPEGEQKQIRGVDGVTRSRTFFDNMEKLTYEVIPSAATRTLAGPQNILPARGTYVTILTGVVAASGGASVETQATGSGTGDGTGAFLFITGEKKITVDNEVRLTMELERGEVQDARISHIKLHLS